MSDETKVILKQGYESQAEQYFSDAAELTIATNAIKREIQVGHLHMDSPLTADQINQRKQILGIAHAVIDGARKRALEGYHTYQALAMHEEITEKFDSTFKGLASDAP